MTSAIMRDGSYGPGQTQEDPYPVLSAIYYVNVAALT